MRWLRHFHQPCLPLGPNGTRISGSAEHIALSRQAAGEGIVLLKNRNALPLAKGRKVVLLGKAGEEYIKGGGGSGDVSVAYVRSLYESLQEKQTQGKVQLYAGLHEFYAESVRQQHEAGMRPGMTREPQLTQAQLEAAAAFSDTAIVAICRFSGEGWDRHCESEKQQSLMETGSNDSRMRAASRAIFQRADFYLSEEEEAMVAQAKAYFAHLIVVLNVGGMVDTAWFSADDAVEAALFAGQGGMEGAMAIGDVLCGDVNPSGKLVDTFADSLEAYPSTEGFHASTEYVEYTEDIYVGYRYFETVPGQSRKVVYPFGFGLSYTQFSISTEYAELTDNRLLCDAKVTNIGETAGKEVVQLYFSAPEGKLGKPALQLAAFEKTPLLAPGQSVCLHLEVPFADMASYDDLGLVKKSAWVLEKGCYRFFLGSSVRDHRELPVSLTLEEDRVTLQLTEKLAPRKLTKRMRADGSYQTLPCSEYPPVERAAFLQEPEKLMGAIPEIRFEGRSYMRWAPCFQPKPPQLADVEAGKLTLDEFLNTLSLEEMVCLLGGQPNTGVANTFGMGGSRLHGIPAVMTADGPAGVRIDPQLEVYTTAWPCATSLACTWNREILYRVGCAAAQEVKENNLGIWLAPGMNIHRSPLCGRNFEYYSEDPLIAGEMGTAMVRGVQSQRIAATPKHFACNNKETNRHGSDSRVSERAAREIYLKGFETVVRKAQPWLIMSSYNLVNGTHSSENRELLTDILRDEWGFTGIVTTDWWTRAEHWREVKAGNDVKMACGYPEQLLEAVQEGKLTEQDVRICAKRVLRMLLRVE